MVTQVAGESVRREPGQAVIANVAQHAAPDSGFDFAPLPAPGHLTQVRERQRQARDDGQLLVLASVVSNVRKELENFADLKEKYLSNPEVQSLFALCDETETESES